jgi:ring-1,2-phenylacetyl-CoA epoxidase subunit PaaC
MSRAAVAIDLAPQVREALAELLLSLADDDFVLGAWDSEWTGIAPLLEEDVALSSIAQDEVGHASLYYHLLAELTGEDADTVAFGREAGAYRHARLLDHPRTDWAFTIARRYLYDTADAVRLECLADCSFVPLAGAAAKIRREESYHLMHMEAWLRRIADAGGEPHRRLTEALEALWPDALTVLAPLPARETLLEAGILPERWRSLDREWLARIAPVLTELGLPFPFREEAQPDGRRFVPDFDPDHDTARTGHGADFDWLWGEFTMVYRQDPSADW